VIGMIYTDFMVKFQNKNYGVSIENNAHTTLKNNFMEPVK
jgi:hypothetical protein